MDEREELDLLRKQKRLRELESKAAGSEPPPERTQLAPDGRPVPSLRQGSADDQRQVLEVPREPEPQFSADNPLRRSKAVSRLATGAETVLEGYEKHVGKPYRDLMFKEDPLETIAKRPQSDSVLGMTWDRIRAFGEGALLDPLGAVTGAYGVGRSALRSGLAPTAPHVIRQPEVAIKAPVVQPPQGPSATPLRPIQELAGEHQSQLLGAAPEVSSAPVGVPGVTQPADVRTLPTGSIERGAVEEPSSATHRLPNYAEIPTGSRLKTKKYRQTVNEGETPVYPPYPAETHEPGVRDLDLSSKRMHGRDISAEQGPPKTYGQSAEDLLQAQEAAQQKRFEQLQAERAGMSGSDGGGPTPPRSTALSGAEPPEFESLLRQPDQMGPRGGPVPIPVEKSLEQGPLTWRRFFLHAYDFLDDMGPRTRRLSDILRYSWDYSEQGTRQNFLDYTKLLEKYFGSRTLGKKVELAKESDWNSLLNRSSRDFGLTQKEVDALVELHEAGGDVSRVSPAALERLPVHDPKLQALAQEGWQVLTGRASGHPSIQSKARITDPITGESTPVGPASMYWPHHPVKLETKQILSEANLRRIYEDRGYSQKMDFEQFRDLWDNYMMNDEAEIRLRRYAGIEAPRMLDMLKDAKTHNRTVAESLRHYGYETDPLRVSLRHNLYSLKRAVFLEHEEEMKQLMQSLRRDYGEGSAEYRWIKDINAKTQGISLREDMLRTNTNVWEMAKSILYPAFLKGSWLQNFLLQPNYIHMQVGMKPIAQAIWRRYGKILGMTEKDILEAADRSGANFPAFMSKYHQPSGPWEQYNKTANELNFFNMSDAYTRTWAGEVYIPHAETLARRFWNEPSNKKWQAALREGNINPEELYTRMSAEPKGSWDAQGVPPVPQSMLMRYAQTQANRAMGRTGVRSLPNYMAGEGDIHKVFMMLHRQIASNEGVFWRNISSAPTAGEGLKRALRAVFGAELAGTLYQGTVNWIMGNGFFDVNEPLAKSFGNNKEAAFAVKSLLLGLGTLTSGIVLSGLNMHAGNYGGATYGLLSPPIATFVDEFAQKLAKGKFDEAAMRLQPSQIADVLYRRHKKEERQRHKSGVPSQSFGGGLGMGLSQ